MCEKEEVGIFQFSRGCMKNNGLQCTHHHQQQELTVNARIAELMDRKKEDHQDFAACVSNHPTSSFLHHGCIHYQGSEAQELLKQDIEEKLHEKMGKKALWAFRSEYHLNFPPGVFQDKIKGFPYVQCLSTIRTEYLNANAVYLWFKMYKQIYVITISIRWSRDTRHFISYTTINGIANRL
jgi:hypothetical protein